MTYISDKDVRCPECNKKLFHVNSIFGIIRIEIKCNRCGSIVKYITPMPAISSKGTNAIEH